MTHVTQTPETTIAMSRATKLAAPAGRLLLAFIFIMSGAAKLGDLAGTAAYIETAGLPGILVYPTVALEIIGGLFLVVGYRARLSALLLAGFTMLAGVLYHMVPAMALEGMAQQMQMIMFFKNVSITGGLLLVIHAGAGAYALDNRAVSHG